MSRESGPGPEIAQVAEPEKTPVPKPEAKLTERQVTNAFASLEVMRSNSSEEDPKWLLAKSLGIKDKEWSQRQQAEKASYEQAGDSVGPIKLDRIHYLRSLMVRKEGQDYKPDHRAAETIKQLLHMAVERYMDCQRKWKEIKQQPAHENKPADLRSATQKFLEARQVLANIGAMVKQGYPELWQNLHQTNKTAEQKPGVHATNEIDALPNVTGEKPPAEAGATITAATTETDAPAADIADTAQNTVTEKPPIETERNEALPEKPEFLTKEAWRTIYQAGLNYLETEKKNPDPRKGNEITGYFFIDPTNPHLAEELRNLAVEQDKVIADLEASLETETSPTKQRAINNDIERRKKETSWDKADDVIRKTLDPLLKDKIRNDGVLLDEEKQAIRDLIKTPIMQYPTEAEARAILEKLKVSEPDRAVAIYARTEDGQPLKVYINKADKKVHASLDLPRGSRPNYGADTKIISIIGRRISPTELAELKNK